MKTKITKAWKDRSLRASNMNLPAHPAGVVELDETLLSQVSGGTKYTCNPNGCPNFSIEPCKCEIDMERKIYTWPTDGGRCVIREKPMDKFD